MGTAKYEITFKGKVVKVVVGFKAAIRAKDRLDKAYGASAHSYRLAVG